MSPRNRRMLWILGTVGGLGMLALAGLVVASWRRPELGLVDGRLRSCPATPNCVCSQDDPADREHYIAPLSGSANPAQDWSRLRAWLEQRRGVRLIATSENYLHAEFSTPLLHYVDDVEFLHDRAANVIHVRSASRVGRSDLGVNRRRVEELRAALADGGPRSGRGESR